MKNRIISLVLAISVCLSMMVFCAPFAGATLTPSVGNLPAVSYQYSPSVTDHSFYKESMGSALAVSTSPEVMMDMMEHISEFEFNEHGEVSLEELQSIQYSYNNDFLRRLYRQADFNPTTGFFTTAEITEIPSRGILRLIDSKTGAFIADWKGNYPFVRVTGDVAPQNNTVFNNENKWVRLDNLSNLPGVVILDETALARMCADLNTFYGTDCSLYGSGDFYFIKKDRQSFYANFAGKPYVATRGPSAADTVRPPVTEDNVVIEDNNGLVIDKAEGVLNLIGQLGDQFQLNIDNLEFDFGTDSYTVNAYITVNEGDNYYYTYYTYNIQYNITNTYITYIGSNDAYEREEYELYYQLPDGRSSADLTAEEIAGMSFEFYDVVNYQRSTDDVSVRALYHFDGNFNDDSYFGYINEGLKWRHGASLTYMESPSAFGGNLYLDNTPHGFDIPLSTGLYKNDFTIQFRYYQASEPDTVTNVENSLSGSSATFNNDTLLKWDEGILYDWKGYSLCYLPIGTWNEIAIVRNNGVLFYYLNGHCVGQSNHDVVLFNSLSFDFGSSSRAYSMLDEFRVLDFALVEGGADYTPTTVPYDSNLVLVLPDTSRPLVDEYYTVESSYENLLGDRFNQFDGASLDNIKGTSMVPVGDSNYAGNLGVSNFGGSYFPNTFQYRSDVYSVGALGNSVLVSHVNDLADSNGTTNGLGWCWGLGIALGHGGVSGLKENTDYTMSIVHEDGTVDSFTFNTGSTYFHAGGWDFQTSPAATRISYKVFPWGRMQYSSVANTLVSASRSMHQPVVSIIPNSGMTVDFAYIEFVEGATTDVHLVKHTAVYDGDEVEPNTAAIQSTIPVKGYTVGGVRPSLPAKGDLWFPVMNNRITSVQIYTGSHWEEVNARWWTGSRWIPIYAFDINTLEDLFDIADGDSIVPLLPDQNSFLRWWQLQWLDFRAWLEKTLGSGSGGGGSGSDCQHVYSSKITRDPGCIEPGITTFTCSECGHQYTQLIDAHGHDWLTTDTVPDVLDDAGTVIEEGYDVLTCSVCDATAKDYGGGPEEDDLFDALGDLLAGGVEWLLDKLTQLADGLRQITDTFNEYVEKVKGFGGEYPALFAAAFVLFPEELQIFIWLVVIALVVLAVWKKYSS